MPGGIKAVKIIYTVLAWISLIAGILVGIIMMVVGGAIGASAQEGAAGGFAAMAGLGIFYIIFGIIVFILYFFTAKGVANKKNYGKIMAIIFGILMLPSIPIGTILGIVILINMFNDQGKAWFAGTAPVTAE
ncbi:hypothetical protein KAU34_10885 [candidate division WOR-3 bacterium]|nr:hypothetical protein [candidate division WOR-3 bacterium]